MLKRRAFMVLAWLLVAALGIVVAQQLSLAWFQHELEGATLELMRNEARETARQIKESLPRLIERQSGLQNPTAQIRAAIGRLLERHPSIRVAWWSDAHGRLVSLRMSREDAEATTGSLFDQGRTFFGYNDEALLRAFAQENPGLEPLAFVVQADGRPVGHLRILVDRRATRQAVATAARRMTARMTLLLTVLLVVIAIAAVVIQYQRAQAARLRRQREEAAQMAQVGALAAGLAHEIRNPINALGMELEMLADDLIQDGDEDGARRLEKVRTSLMGIEGTVRDFLTYGAPDRPCPRHLDLAAELGALKREFEGGDGPSIECQAPPELTVWCDPYAIRQVLGNLVSNARRALARDPADRPALIRISAARRGPNVELRVEDSGPGVPENSRARLFECFYTTYSEGTGLGLPIARRLTELNGGHLALDDEPSPLGGASFRLWLPTEPGRAATGPAARSPGAALDAS